MIRKIHRIESDLATHIALLGKLFVAELKVTDGFNAALFVSEWNRLLDAGIAALWLAEHDGRPVGGIGAIRAPTFYDGKLSVMESFWYVVPGHRKSEYGLQLLDHMESWARESGASRVLAGHTAQAGEMRHLYERKGYRQYEVQYVKDL